MKFEIEGYENMTPEEKLAALEAYEPDMSGFIAKATFDKTASELAAAKKQLKERMTEDESKAAKEAEEQAALIARVEELENDRAVNNYVTAYIGMGYDEKTARSTAEALVKGDMNTVFANQKTHIKALQKELETEKLKNTPAPGAGTPAGSGMTLEKLRAMTPAERYEYSQNNPDEYKNLYGGT